MAEEQNQDPLMMPEQNASAQFQIQKLYTKDVSFELPNAPQVFREEGQADVKMSLAQRVEEMGDDFNEQTAHAVMNTLCPGTLFPYARQMISTLVAEGGFPPLVLQPVNFEQLYAQRMQQMMEEQKNAAAQGNGGSNPAEFSSNE